MSDQPSASRQWQPHWTSAHAASRMAVAAAVVGLLTIGILAQTATPVPDFSGRWLPVAGASKPAELPLGSGFVIAQDDINFTVTAITKAVSPVQPQRYLLNGSKTTRVERAGADRERVFTSTAAWKGLTLVITTEEGFSKAETTYALDEAGTGNLVVTASTTLLYKKNDKLTVDTIGPFVRVYKKS